MNTSLKNIQGTTEIISLTTMVTEITLTDKIRTTITMENLSVLQWRRPHHAQLRGNSENRPQFVNW